MFHGFISNWVNTQIFILVSAGGRQKPLWRYVDSLPGGQITLWLIDKAFVALTSPVKRERCHYCHLRKEIKGFALSRISEAKVLAKSFKKPADFDFKKYFLSTFGLYKGKSTKEVTLRFTPEKSKWIKDQKVKHLKDGSIELSFPVSDFSEIKMEILKHGGMVEVIKPKSLKDLIKAEAEKIVKIY